MFTLFCENVVDKSNKQQVSKLLTKLLYYFVHLVIYTSNEAKIYVIIHRFERNPRFQHNIIPGKLFNGILHEKCPMS